MQYGQRKLHRSVTETRRPRSGRPRRSPTPLVGSPLAGRLGSVATTGPRPGTATPPIQARPLTKTAAAPPPTNDQASLTPDNRRSSPPRPRPVRLCVEISRACRGGWQGRRAARRGDLTTGFLDPTAPGQGTSF